MPRRVCAPSAIGLFGLMLAAGGCQSYERAPLDRAALREAFLSRSPSDETARAFADRLALNEGRAPQEFDPADGLTLAEAEPVALVFNRELRLARLEAGVTLAAAEHAGRWEDPVAGLDLERIVSSVPDPWIALGTIGLTIPISGRLAVEKDRAGAEHAAELHRVAAKEWAMRAALRELWIEWSAQSHRVRIAVDLVERLRDVADLAHRQSEVGVMSRIDARLFRVELAQAEAELIETRARAAELRLQLHEMLGLAPEAPVVLVETIAFTTPQTDAPWSLEALESGNVELAAVRTEYEVAEQSLRLEVRKQYPDLTIGPGYGTDQGDDRVLLGLQLPIPLWNRNQQGVAEAAAERNVARGRFESTYEHLASSLAIAATRHEAGRAMRQAVETQVLPLADEQDAEVQRVAELGRVDPLLLLQAIQSQSEAKVLLINARAAEAVGAIRLAELIGPSVLPESTSPPDGADPHTQTQVPGVTP